MLLSIKSRAFGEMEDSRPPTAAELFENAGVSKWEMSWPFTRRKFTVVIDGARSNRAKGIVVVVGSEPDVGVWDCELTLEEALKRLCGATVNPATEENFNPNTAEINATVKKTPSCKLKIGCADDCPAVPLTGSTSEQAESECVIEKKEEGAAARTVESQKKVPKHDAIASVPKEKWYFRRPKEAELFGNPAITKFRMKWPGDPIVYIVRVDLAMSDRAKRNVTVVGYPEDNQGRDIWDVKIPFSKAFKLLSIKVRKPNVPPRIAAPAKRKPPS